MDRISSWCIRNALILDLKKGKTEEILFGTSKILSMQSDSFSHENIHFATSYKHLGIEFDQTLNLNSYFNTIYKKSKSRLKILCRIRTHLDNQSAKLLYQSMLVPLFTYCGILQLNYCASQKMRLEALHRRALNLVNTNSNFPSPYSMNLIHSLTFVHCCVHDDSVCSDFKDYFEIVAHTRNTSNM